MYLEERSTTPEPDAGVKVSVGVPTQSHSVQQPRNAIVSQTRCRAADPVIARFRAALTDIQLSELERLYGRLPDLDDRARDAIQQFADRLVANVLRSPVECLSKKGDSGSQQYLLAALERLFRLSD
jgi:glutamyl-tRNA reductase